jgi:hypothetical protein
LFGAGHTELLGYICVAIGRHTRSTVGLEKGEGFSGGCLGIEMVIQVRADDT